MLETCGTAFTCKQMAETQTRTEASGSVIMDQTCDRSQIRIKPSYKKQDSLDGKIERFQFAPSYPIIVTVAR